MIGESIVPVPKWRRRLTDALLVVSFFLIGFFSALGDAAADHNMTELRKPDTPASTR
jgi:hypothetical protein